MNDTDAAASIRGAAPDPVAMPPGTAAADVVPPGGFAAVTTLLQTYFDGLHHSDTARLRQVFHSSALYATASTTSSASTGPTTGADSQLTALTMARYFPIVDARPSPASRGEARHDRILRIEFIGPTTALAVVQCAIGAKRFTDLLNLLWLDGRWQIIAKVFHAEAAEAPV